MLDNGEYLCMTFRWWYWVAKQYGTISHVLWK